MRPRPSRGGAGRPRAAARGAGRPRARAAQRTGLPLVLHVVRRDGPMLDALRPRTPAARHGPRLHRQRGDGACLRGARAAPLLRRRAHPAERASHSRGRRRDPPDRVLLETDAPDQTPTGAPTDRNEPSYLPLVATALDRPEVDAAANAHALFGWP
ncbi:MAG: TatD family hydrolase [Sandaracinus sp.]|nr:TatD family hydrolase [Sandaracinus sp.]